MRKYMFIPLLCLMISHGVNAQEHNEIKTKRFNFHWSVGFAGQPEAFNRTSIIGFGMRLPNVNGWSLVNQLQLRNGVMILEDRDQKYYQKVIANKVSFGKPTLNGLYRPYGFIEGRLGTLGDNLYDFTDNPLVSSVGLGTGLNLNTTNALGYFMELGFVGTFYEEQFIPQQRFELGVQLHF